MENSSCFGNDSDPDCWEFSDYAQRVLISCLLTLITIVGLFGNSLVILAVYVSRKLRNPTNVFVVNLAIADLISCFFVIANIIALLAKDDWPLPEWVCASSAAILMTCLGVSLYNLGVIAYNRYVLITKTVVDYQRYFGEKRNIAVWLGLVWTIPILVVNVPIMIGWGEVGFNRKYHSCSDRPDIELEYEHLYDSIIGLGLFPIPLVTVAVCYIRIYIHVINHAQKLSTKEDSETMSTTNNTTQDTKLDDSGIDSHLTDPSSPTSLKSPTPPSAYTKRSAFASQRSVNTRGRRFIRRDSSMKSHLSKRQIEITKNLFYVLCAFLMCISPYLLVQLLGEVRGAPFLPYAVTILMFNSCINWVIYATKQPYFKQIFKSIVLCRWNAIPEPIESIRESRLPCINFHCTNEM